MKITIQKASIEDAQGIAEVHIRSWQSSYRGIIADSYLNDLNIAQKADWWTKALSQGASVYIAETEQIVGFASAGKNSDPGSIYQGELYAFYLLEEYQRRGVGKLLFNEVVKELLARELGSMIVWVLQDNPSKNFYINQGGQYIKEKEIRIGEQILTEEAYGWNDLSNMI